MRYAAVPNQMPQYHKVKLPEGLIVVGDAMLALNPVYGQGMSVAAMGAGALDRCLSKALAGKCTAESRRSVVRTVGARLQKKLQKKAAVAWQLATTEDMR